MAYLLDTNVFVDWQVRDNPSVNRSLQRHRGSLLLSSIVLHEMLYGAFFSKRTDRNVRQIESLGLPLITFDRHDALEAGRVRAALRRAGTPIGPYDTLLAGQALARNLTLVTSNTGEFSRVAGLQLENWASG